MAAHGFSGKSQELQYQASVEKTAILPHSLAETGNNTACGSGIKVNTALRHRETA